MVSNKYFELDGGATEQALVDLALVDDSFTGSRAVWNGQQLLEMVAAIAERATVGLSSIASRVAPTSRHQPGGVHVIFGDGERFRIPIAPGLFSEVDIASWRRLQANDSVEISGPGVLSFDGERDVVLASGRSARVTVSHDGLWVIDIEKARGPLRNGSTIPDAQTRLNHGGRNNSSMVSRG